MKNLFRFIVNLNNGDIAFRKVWIFKGEAEVTEYAVYKQATQKTLDFVQEAQNRFENEYPEWADVLSWQLIAEDDYTDFLNNPTILT